MIEVKNLSKTYRQKDNTRLTVLRDINFSMNKGEVISIIGPSGTGKSTLLRCINGLEHPDSGTVLFNNSSSGNTAGGRIGMVFQNFNLFEHLTVLENVTIAPRKLLKLSPSEADRQGMEMLRLVGMAEKSDSMPSQLSGGQKQRVAIARCLAMQPECILFDEPTSALDPTMVNEVLNVIRNLASQNLTMLIVTHEMQFARDVSTRVLFLYDGTILEDGSPEQVFEHPHYEETRAFLQSIHKLHHELPFKGILSAKLIQGLYETIKDKFSLRKS